MSYDSFGIKKEAMNHQIKTATRNIVLYNKGFKNISRDLFLELLEKGGSVHFMARGGSMGYIIKEGDLITIKKEADKKLKIGDIVILNFENNLVCHRVISYFNRNGERYYITKGDAILQSDPPLPASHMIGKVFHIQRGNKSLNLEGKLVRCIGYCSALYSKFIFYLYSRFGFYRTAWENPKSSKLPLWLRRNFERMLRVPMKLMSSLLFLTAKSSIIN